MKVNMKVLACGVIASSLTSCMWMASTPSGIREFYRGNNGLVTTGKAKPNELDEYHKTQRYTEEQKTLRIRLGGEYGRSE